MMKQKINGYVYDTEKSTIVKRYDYGDWMLLRTKTGRYFGYSFEYKRFVPLTESYVKAIDDFNEKSGAAHMAWQKFITFRKTSRGICVGFTAGKPNEIAELNRNVKKAGSPYYCKIDLEC